MTIEQIKAWAKFHAQECIVDRDGDVCVRPMRFSAAGERIATYWPDPRDFVPVGAMCVEWSDGDGSGHEGYHVDDYFRPDGTYRGPDKHGIEPIFRDMTPSALDSAGKEGTA